MRQVLGLSLWRCGDNVNADLKLLIFAEIKCNFLPVSTGVYTAIIHNFTCRYEARQALIYQLVFGLTGENDKYNYSKAVHIYPPFFDITYPAKNYKIALALTLPPAEYGQCSGCAFRQKDRTLSQPL